MEYLELVLLISLVVSAYQYGKGTKELQDKVDDLEGKLDGVEKLLVELQPKGPVEIPVRLDDEVVNEMTEMTKQDMEEHQTEKAEFQEKMKVVNEKYSKKTLTTNEQNVLKELYGEYTPKQIVKEYWDEYNEKKYTSEERLDELPEKTKQDIREYIEKQTKQKQGKK